MSDKIIKIKIDVTKIDKEKLYKGQKGTYLDATLFLKDKPDQYDNYGMITQDVSESDRKAGVKGNILGNVKIFTPKGQQPAQTSGSSQKVTILNPEPESDLPF